MTDKITMDKTYKTRRGLPVRVLADDRTSSDGTYMVVAMVDYGAEEDVLTYTASGEFFAEEPSDLDLIEVRPEKVVWIVVDGDSIISSYKHEGDARAWQWEVGGTIHKVTLNKDNEVE